MNQNHHNILVDAAGGIDYLTKALEAEGNFGCAYFVSKIGKDLTVVADAIDSELSKAKQNPANAGLAGLSDDARELLAKELISTLSERERQVLQMRMFGRVPGSTTPATGADSEGGDL